MKFGELFNDKYAALRAEVETKIIELVKLHNLKNVVFYVTNIGNSVLVFKNDKEDELLIVEEEYLNNPYPGGVHELRFDVALPHLIILLIQIENYVESNIDEQ